jgi:murein DD-endopeptidase MepM/ murein hydrolase activator NlpD
MLRWICWLALLASATACSQRSTWRSAPTPSPRQQAADIALSRPTVLAAPDDATAVAAVGTLLFPVAGVDDTRIEDSFDDKRDGGARTHQAIDIMAPRGTPVLSVQDGRIVRLTSSAKGGMTIYATDRDEKFVFYYAHLDRYHPTSYVGRPLVRGDTIGYVGTSGNAPESVPHLHFQVMRMPADRKYWNGEPINPYPLLRRATPQAEK